MRPPSPTADALSQLAARRDPGAWSALVERHGPAIHRLSLRILRDASAAEDACQETFLSIRACAAQFSPRGDQPELAATGWIMRIAVNCALQLARRKHAGERREKILDEGMHAPRTTETESVEMSLVRREIEALPDSQKQVICLHFDAGLDYPEVAQALGCSVNNARVRMHRGLETLRKRLAGLGIVLTFAALSDCLHAAEGGAAFSPQALDRFQNLLHSSAKPTLVTKVSGEMTLMTKFAIAGATFAAAGLLAFMSLPGTGMEELSTPAIPPPDLAKVEGKIARALPAPAIPISRFGDLNLTLDYPNSPLSEVVRLMDQELRIPTRLDVPNPASLPPFGLSVTQMKTREVLIWLTQLTDTHHHRAADGTFVFTERPVEPDAEEKIPSVQTGARGLPEIDFAPTDFAVENANAHQFLQTFYRTFGRELGDCPAGANPPGRISIRTTIQDGLHRKEGFLGVMTNDWYFDPVLPHPQLLKRPLSVDFTDSPLTDVFAAIERATGVRVRLGRDDYVIPRITLQAGEMEAEGLLHTIDEEASFLHGIGGDGAVVLYRTTPVELPYLQDETLVISAPLGRRLISVDFKDQSIDQIADYFRAKLGIPFWIDEGAKCIGRFTLGLENREVMDVVNALAWGAHAGKLEIEDNSTIVLRKPDPPRSTFKK
jgi:RNA polymerase sigma-70 factor (ECF subfamily)